MRDVAVRLLRTYSITKPLAVGVLTSASKKGKVTPEDLAVAVENMATLNKVGEALVLTED